MKLAPLVGILLLPMAFCKDREGQTNGQLSRTISGLEDRWATSIKRRHSMNHRQERNSLSCSAEEMAPHEFDELMLTPNDFCFHFETLGFTEKIVLSGPILVTSHFCLPADKIGRVGVF